MTSRGILLVGASSDIGTAIARRLSLDGDRVLGVSLEAHEDPALVEALELDCGTTDGAEAAVTAALHLLGRLDVVVAAAGAMPVARAHEATDDDWQRAITGCLDATFKPIRAAIPHLPGGGAIVAVSSVNAVRAAPGLPGYAAAKGGVEALVRQLALDYGPRGLRVNAVAPGTITTTPEEHAAEEYPLRRVGRPEEVASAVRFLASDDAGFVTGAVLPVDGGLSIASPAAFVRPDLRERFL